MLQQDEPRVGALPALARRLAGPILRYARWLHLQWPAGAVEPLPDIRPDGSTAVPGLYVAGDLAGVPLLKFAADSGARAVAALATAPGLARDPGGLDLIIVGAGIAGMAAALQARALGLRFQVVEASGRFATVADFPRGKPIFTEPLDMVPAGALRLRGDTKEALLTDLRAQTADVPVTAARVESVQRQGGRLVCALAGGGSLAAAAVLLTVGKSGDYRRLEVPGADLGKVYHRLHDASDFADKDVLVVGGGDSAVEAALLLSQAGARVTLCHRGAALTRPRQASLEALRALQARGLIDVRRSTQVRRVDVAQVELVDAAGRTERLANDVVFALIGREAPLDLLRRCGVPARGQWTRWTYVACGLFFLFCVALYNWKSGGALAEVTARRGLFPHNLQRLVRDPASLWGVVLISASGPSFWYTLAYSSIILWFGARRIRARRTPYVTWQTLVLMAVQIGPLFLLPEILLPWLGQHDLLPRGLLDALFPVVGYGHGREYWRAYGLTLAWPLFIYNVFTSTPLWAWLGISLVQTAVLIPLLVYFYGKGAYCGWICSCGALAETLGDRQRHKMPHGPASNRLNLIGQGILLIALLLLLVRVVGWVAPGLGIDRFFFTLVSGSSDPHAGLLQRWVNYKWAVDVFLAGAVGYGAYFWFSGRVWCRFLCPLAALMHIYARLSRFRIFADKRRCISCNVCTSVCHMGIDVMSFASQGRPMQDPQCVRCSACVDGCPTDVLRFGRLDRHGHAALDRLPARQPERLYSIRSVQR